MQLSGFFSVLNKNHKNTSTQLPKYGLNEGYIILDR